MVKKVIQVPMDEELLKSLNRLSKKQRKSRAEVIRQACSKYLDQAREAELDRIYVEGYKRIPETPEMGELGAALLAEHLATEIW
jgi:metal-responsive CopG/Arc/MetJ family transcriptional regulator